MLPKLEHIRQARLRIGVTQKQLASLTGVSTSMINQIESGKCKPSYETAKRIFETLNRSIEDNSPKAGEICCHEIVYTGPDDSLLKAAEIMRDKGFSQLPVFENGTPIGLITDEGIIQVMLNDGPENIGKRKTRHVMHPCPPMVDESTPARTLIPLVKFTKTVLVASKGKVIGIITQSEALGMV